MYRTDAPGNVNGMYDGGDPIIPRQATIVAASHLNAFQEELVGPIEAAGIPLDKTNNKQLNAALVATYGRLGFANTWAGNQSIGGSLSVTATTTLTGAATLNGTTRVNAKLGLNVAPTFPLDVGDTGAVGNALARFGSSAIPLFVLGNGGFNYTGIGFNCFYDTADKRAVTGYCSDIAQSSDGSLRVRTGGTGAAGTVTLTEKLVVPQTGPATSGAANVALLLPNGHLSLDGTVAPASTVAVKNMVTPANITKVVALIVVPAGKGAGTFTDLVPFGSNVASVTLTSNTVVVTFAQPFTSPNFAVFRDTGSANNSSSIATSYTTAAGSVAFSFNGTLNPTTTAFTLSVKCYGAQ